MHLNRRTFATGIASTAGLLVAPGALAESAPNATPGATPVSGDLESRLLAALKEYGVPGAVVAVQTAQNLEPTIYELGVANIQSNEPVSADMHFRIGSVTKTFTATVVLQLVDEGTLALDDTISDVLPDLQVANAEIITVRHLLGMLSGLPQLLETPEAQEMMTDPTTELTFDEIASIGTSLPAQNDPGIEWDYNNLNYQILGEMVHTITGEPWDANLSRRILQPMEMSSTGFPTTPEMPEPFAHGYGYVSSEPIEASPVPSTPLATVSTPETADTPIDMTAFHPSIAGASGGMVSTVTDLLSWASVFASGELLTSETYATQLDGIPAGAYEGALYGLGAIIIDGLIGHVGGINGYQGASFALADRSLAIAILTNANPTPGPADPVMNLTELVRSSVVGES